MIVLMSWFVANRRGECRDAANVTRAPMFVEAVIELRCGALLECYRTAVLGYGCRSHDGESICFFHLQQRCKCGAKVVPMGVRMSTVWRDCLSAGRPVSAQSSHGFAVDHGSKNGLVCRVRDAEH